MDKTFILLIRGSQRRAFLSNLPESPFLSNKLRKELNEKHQMNLSLREVSRPLRDFEKKFLVKCLNRKDPYNHIYELTTKGKKIRKEIFKSDL